MLSWHTLSSKWPSGEQGGGQVKCAREGQVAKWGISRNGSKKRNTQERLNTRKAERRKKNTEEKTLTVPRAIFLPKKKKKKRKKAKTGVLGGALSICLLCWNGTSQSQRVGCLSKVNHTPANTEIAA